MELNRLIEKKLTPKQKRKYEQDNGKFKVLSILIILPIVTTILGMFIESIAVVSISIVFIILCLLFIAFSTKKRNIVYERIIVPIVLQERFRNIEHLEGNEEVEDRFQSSELGEDYTKFEAKNSLVLNEDGYDMTISKIVTKKKKIYDEESEEEKEFEKSFSGLFTYLRIPNTTDIDLKVLENLKTKKQINEIDKADVQRVIMNNMEFDTQYDVMSSDPSVARRVLSLGVMARILEIDRKLGKVISFSIKDNYLYILIRYDDFLEFGSNKKNEYVDEDLANQNMDVIETVDYFTRYIINLI